MPISGYFDTPFASSGTKTPVPDPIQVSGTISYTQGWGPNYTLAPTNPNYLPVDEGSMNQLFFDITSAIQYQQQGLPPAFITSAMNGGTPFSYGQYAIVLQGGVAYQSLVAGNADTPPSSKWVQVNLSSANVFTGGVSTGSANAQVLAALTPATGFSLSNNGQSIVFTAGFTNTGATTLAITSPTVAATAIKKLSGGSIVPLAGGEIIAGNSTTVTVNTTAGCFVLNSGPALGAMAFLGISGNSGGSDGSSNYAPWEYCDSVAAASRAYSIGDWANLIVRSHGGAAMTDTTPGTSGALPNGEFFFVRNGDASASLTITPDSGGAYALGSTNPAAIIIAPGETYKAISQGGGAFFWELSELATIPAPAPTGAAKNLFAAWASTTTLGMSADQIVVTDAAGNSKILNTVAPAAMSTGTTGAGGTDVAFSGFSSSSWAYLYVIYNPTTAAIALLLSASASAPTLPAGYTFKALVSAARLDGSKNLVGYTQYGNRVEYVVGRNLAGLPAIITGSTGNLTTPTWTSASISSVCPAIAGQVGVMLSSVGGTAVCMAAPNGSYGALQSTTNPPPLVCAASGTGNADNKTEYWNVQSTNVFYVSQSGNCGLFCVGFVLNL